MYQTTLDTDNITIDDVISNAMEAGATTDEGDDDDDEDEEEQ